MSRRYSGVFRYSAISATDQNVVFGGSNNIWVVFQDYVVVIDANFPKEAGDVIEANKKTTDKPIRYVLDTHHHGDHAYGNSVWTDAGATTLAYKGVAEEMKRNEPQSWEGSAKQRADVRELNRSGPEPPTNGSSGRTPPALLDATIGVPVGTG